MCVTQVETTTKMGRITLLLLCLYCAWPPGVHNVRGRAGDQRVHRWVRVLPGALQGAAQAPRAAGEDRGLLGHPGNGAGASVLDRWRHVGFYTTLQAFGKMLTEEGIVCLCVR